MAAAIALRNRARSVRHNQLLDTLALQRKAQKLIGDRTQSEVADDIGALQPHVGAALGKDHRQRASILVRIIEHYSDFDAEREVHYRLKDRRKGEA